MKETRFLRCWGLVSVNGTGPYLAGHEGFGYFRASTALVRFDPVAGTALTVSGRPYELDGPEDSATAIEAALALWKPTDDQSVTAVPVTEAGEMIRRNKSRLRTNVERDFYAVWAEIDRVVRLCSVIHGIDPDEMDPSIPSERRGRSYPASGNVDSERDAVTQRRDRGELHEERVSHGFSPRRGEGSTWISVISTPLLKDASIGSRSGLPV